MLRHLFAGDRRLAPAVGVLGVLALTLADGRASAQETTSPSALREAEQRFDEGRTLFAQRRFSEAHLKFEQACAVHRTVNCPKNLGLTELEMGKYVEATTHLREFLHNVQVSGQQVGMDAEQLAAIQKRYNEAFMKCGHVEVAAPAGTRIVVNGLVVGTAPLTENTIDVLPGDATVEARTDRGVQKQVVRVSAGEVQPVKFAEPETLPDTAAPVPVQVPPDKAGSAAARTATLVSLYGVALVSAGVGLTLWLHSKARSDDADAVARQLPAGADNACNGTSYADACGQLHSLRDTYDKDRRWMTVAFIGAGVFAAAATTTFFVWKLPTADSGANGKSGGAAGGAGGKKEPRVRGQLTPWVAPGLGGLGYSGSF